MKKRILAILFAMTLVAAMLPAGLAVTAAAEENLIVNGSFEEATPPVEEGVTDWSPKAVGWTHSWWKLGDRVLYSDAEAMGDLQPVAGTGDACFAIRPPKDKAADEALFQKFQLEAGKKYTFSFLFYKKYTNQYVYAFIDFSDKEFTRTFSASGDVTLIKGINYTSESDCWKRVTKTFEVPGTPGETVPATFYIYTRSNGYDGTSIYGYIDDVRCVEAKNQETTVWSTDGFDSLAKSGTNGVINEPGFPFSANSYFYGLNDAGTAVQSMKGGIWDTPTTDFVTYEDGNTVLRMSTSSLGISKALINTPETFADVEIGTPLRISYKARLVDIPDDLDTTATPTFGEYVFYGHTNVNLYEPYVVGSNQYEPSEEVEGVKVSAIKDGEGNNLEDGTQIYLEIPPQYTRYLLPLSLSTQNVNEANKNANEWVEYETIIPYTGVMMQAIITSGCTNTNMDTSLPVGYSWELDDLEVTVADTAVLAGAGTVDDLVISTRNWAKSGYYVTGATENADGTGAKYTMPNWNHGWENWRTISYYETALNADKSAKTYAKADTTAGAAYISAEDAAGASVVTAVYKTVDGDRTLVGVNVANAAAGLVAAPEVALSAITAEAGTYEVATYILALTTGTLKPLGESAIVQIQ